MGGLPSCKCNNQGDNAEISLNQQAEKENDEPDKTKPPNKDLEIENIMNPKSTKKFNLSVLGILK